jgi:lysozyme family protein
VNFDTSFGELINHEGGYVNNPADPGGETKFGISKRAYPKEDIRNMTLERAKEIYRHDYWEQAGGEVLPEAIRFDVFDMAVNSGPRAAIKTLQKSVGQTEDGLIGVQTLMAVNTLCNAPGGAFKLIARFNACRLVFMADLAAWPSFGRGWCKRVAHNILSA